MSKPITAIYIHFLDYYHSSRATGAYLARKREVEKEAHLAFRMALLFAETAIIPASSYFESPLCRAMIKCHPEFSPYGVLKLSARDLSLLEHIESKRAAYDERSPEQFLQAYRRKSRVPFPRYIQKRSSSTDRIRCGWMDTIERTDPRMVLDPEGAAGLTADIEQLWPKIPDMLGDRAFVPSHVADIFSLHGVVLPSRGGLNAVIEPLLG
jgi:hypothetical protein